MPFPRMERVVMSGESAPYARLVATTWPSGLPSRLVSVLDTGLPIPARDEEVEWPSQSWYRRWSSYPDARVTRAQWRTEIASRDLVNRDAVASRGVTR